MDYPRTPTLTVEEAAKILRIGRSSAYEAVRVGQIPSIRVGRKLRVPTARLMEMLGVKEDHPSRVELPEEEVNDAGKDQEIPTQRPGANSTAREVSREDSSEGAPYELLGLVWDEEG